MTSIIIESLCLHGIYFLLVHTKSFHNCLLSNLFVCLIKKFQYAFQVTNAIIVTQDFHLPRAIYIAKSKGLNVFGMKADKQEYPGIDRLRFREKLAMVKVFIEISINKKPRLLGEKIPITGNSALSYDEK